MSYDVYSWNAVASLRACSDPRRDRQSRYELKATKTKLVAVTLCAVDGLEFWSTKVFKHGTKARFAIGPE